MTLNRSKGQTVESCDQCHTVNMRPTRLKCFSLARRCTENRSTPRETKCNWEPQKHTAVSRVIEWRSTSSFSCFGSGYPRRIDHFSCYVLLKSSWPEPRSFDLDQWEYVCCCPHKCCIQREDVSDYSAAVLLWGKKHTHTHRKEIWLHTHFQTTSCGDTRTQPLYTPTALNAARLVSDGFTVCCFRTGLSGGAKAC